MPIEITKIAALNALREVVKEAGEDHVAVCAYAHNREPGCIVGQVFHRLGVPIESLQAMDDPGTLSVGYMEATSLDNLASEGVLDALGIHVEDGALPVLRTAQSHQDAGASWGLALRYAEGVAQYPWKEG